MLRACSLSLLMLVIPLGSIAQTYPAKPVRIIVPYAPGGDTDTVARLLAPQLSRTLGQPFIVENRPGAGSLIGTEAMLRAPADGYTIAMGTISSLAVLPVTKASVSYDPLKDIAPISRLTQVPYVLVAHPSVPARSVAALVRLARSQPGALTYGTPGIATGVHLTSEYFSSTAGVKLVHVPYKGGGPAVVDIVAGNISLMFSTFATTGQFVKAGRLRALAVASAGRVRDHAEVPTMAESGYPGFEASPWNSVVAKAGTPPGIITRLNREIVHAAREGEVNDALQKAGFDVVAGPVEAFEQFLRSELAKWGKVARAAGVRIP